jgi:hypothetical protein
VYHTEYLEQRFNYIILHCNCKNMKNPSLPIAWEPEERGKPVIAPPHQISFRGEELNLKKEDIY